MAEGRHADVGVFLQLRTALLQQLLLSIARRLLHVLLLLLALWGLLLLDDFFFGGFGLAGLCLFALVRVLGGGLPHGADLTNG